MLGGVAFFSYIMGNFIEIVSNYEKKMGIVDKSGDLHNWLLLLTRFTNNQPLPKSLTAQIEQNFNYFWQKNRLESVHNEEDRAYLQVLPDKVKTQIMTVYLWCDIFNNFKKFFNIDNVKDCKFLYDVGFGFMPRNFDPNSEDKIIYDEEDDVIEMYFIVEGIVGVGFSLIANGFRKNPYKIAKRYSPNQVICDHYLCNDLKSQFIYMAMKEIKSFALTKKFLLYEVFPKYPDIAKKIKIESYNNYKKNIFKPVNTIRKAEIQEMNRRSNYRSIQINETEV